MDILFNLFDFNRLYNFNSIIQIFADSNKPAIETVVETQIDLL